MGEENVSAGRVARVRAEARSPASWTSLPPGRPSCSFMVPQRELTVIKISVLYPTTPGGKFDMQYYRTRHIPLVMERCGGAIKRGEVERGIAGGAPGADAPYAVVAHLVFDSMESMQASFAQNLPEFLADLPNFTDIPPTLQISEML